MGIRIAAGIVTAILLALVLKLGGFWWLAGLTAALLLFHLVTRGRYGNYD